MRSTGKLPIYFLPPPALESDVPISKDISSRQLRPWLTGIHPEPDGGKGSSPVLMTQSDVKMQILIFLIHRRSHCL